MNRSKKIFVIISALFILLMVYFTLDIFSKTTAPWKKKRNAIEQSTDTIRTDTNSTR